MEWFDFGIYSCLAVTIGHVFFPSGNDTVQLLSSFPLSVGHNLSASLFGGTTPLVITALISVTGSELMPAYYVMAAAVVGVIAVACMKETAGQPLAGSPPSVATPEEAARMVENQAPAPRF